MITTLVPNGRRMMPAALGASVADPVADPLSHDLVPFRRSPVFLRLVSTMNRAADYAAGGFHVSVDRGQAGGCRDPFSIHASGTKGARCLQPLNRADIRAAWSRAAGMYREAFFATTGLVVGGPRSLSEVRGMLNAANIAADEAFGLEGIEPPRDPGPVSAGEGFPRSGEAAVAYRDRFTLGQKVALAGGIGMGTFGLLGLFAAWTKKRRGGGSWM